MAHTSVDLNSDVGERPQAVAEDAEILRSITSANVACGFHAGDLETMHAICALAVQHGVRIGAHVSYRDRAGFGRRTVELEPEQLAAETVEQISVLSEVAAAEGAEVVYVKPHGALYNRCVTDDFQARAVATGIRWCDPNLTVLGMPDSALARAAQELGLLTEAEGYADRAYLPTGELAPRDQPGTVLELEQAVIQGLELTLNRTAIAINGAELELQVRSLCVHSDTPAAPILVRALRAALEQADVDVAAFA